MKRRVRIELIPAPVQPGETPVPATERVAEVITRSYEAHAGVRVRATPHGRVRPPEHEELFEQDQAAVERIESRVRDTLDRIARSSNGPAAIARAAGDELGIIIEHKHVDVHIATQAALDRAVASVLDLRTTLPEWQVTASDCKKVVLQVVATVLSGGIS